MAAITVTNVAHSAHLVEEFVSMREAGELFDYVIKGGNKAFSIHSLVLASMSPVFKAMLKSNMDESVKREAEFPTIPDGIMSKIIDFTYTGTCTFARDELKPLITAAHYLQITKLQRLCEEQISAVLQPSNCFSWLRFADGLELAIMTPQIQKMMLTSRKEVIESDEFTDAEMSEIAEYLSSLGKKGIHSDSLVEAVLRWIKHDSPNRAVHMTELFACVSLSKCTKPFLSQVIHDNTELLETQQNMYKFLLSEILIADSTHGNLLTLGGQSIPEVQNNDCWIIEENELVKFAEGPGEQLKPYHSMCQVPQGVMVTGGKDSNLCKLFDVTSKKWMDKADLLSPRSHHGSGYLSGKVFVIGGVDSVLTRSVDQMDLETNAWQHGPAIPKTEPCPKVAACNSKLYALLSRKGKLYCLDGEGASWTEKSDMPTASLGCSIAASDDRLFAAGGDGNINYMYIPTTNIWCRLTGPSLRERQGSLVFLKQKLLLVGGCKRDEQLTDVEEYDISSDSWSLAPWKLPKPLFLHGTFVFDSLK